MMKRILIMFALALAVAGMASAAAVCLNGDNVLAASFSCSVGGLTFSNFSAINAGSPVWSNQINIVTVVSTGGVMKLEFNPNMAASQDIHFYFQVSGAPILGAFLADGGAASSHIYERICGNGIVNPAGGDNSCTGGIGNQLAELYADGGGPSSTVMFAAPDSSIWIYKNIAAGSAELSSFTEGFVIPEPMTFVMLGSGLLALGLVRRRRR
jgi:hypothetical protein